MIGCGTGAEYFGEGLWGVSVGLRIQWSTDPG